jgi:hypothetical protein
MPTILPSQVVQAIDSLFGPNRSELDSRMIGAQYQAEVHTLLSLLDEVPRELIDLPSAEYLELSRCRAELATTLTRWNVGDDMRKARAVGSKDAVECIRRLMRQCSDELPPPEPELPFIADLDLARPPGSTSRRVTCNKSGEIFQRLRSFLFSTR